MRKTAIILTIWGAASLAAFAFGARDIYWAISHSSVSTLYTPGHPPPILAQIDVALELGARLTRTGLYSGIVCLVLAAIDSRIQWNKNRRRTGRGFEIVQ